MKYVNKIQFKAGKMKNAQDWEYESEKRAERKKTKEARELRKGKRNQWSSADD